jgi:hypothetical protein
MRKYVFILILSITLAGGLGACVSQPHCQAHKVGNHR